MVWQQVGAKSEMLARAEADFEVERAIFAEQAARADLAVRRNRDLRQQPVDQVLLGDELFVPAGAAVEPVEGQRIARFVRGHGRCG